MINKYGINVKRYVTEMAKSYKGYANYWQKEMIDKYVELYGSGMITERECVKSIVYVIEEMGSHYTFRELSEEAQKNCLDQYINIMCPYDTAGDLDGASFEEIAESINYWTGDQFWFDKNGNWYDEGRMVR